MGEVTMRLIAMILLSLFACAVHAHGGRIDDLGGHKNNAKGVYEVHQGKHAGTEWPTRADYIEFLNEHQPDPSDPGQLTCADGTVLQCPVANDPVIPDPAPKPTAFNVQDYGASPSASPSANVAAFQRAVDAAAKIKGAVFVPAGTYRIDNTIWMRDHVTLEGVGSASHINSVARGKVNGIPTLMLGNYPGRTFNLHTYYSIQAANKNDTVIRFKNAAHASNFKVGDIAAFRSEEGFRGDNRPQFSELNEVVAVGNGTITLKYPLHDRLAGTNPKIARSGEPAVVIRGEPAKVVKQATVRNLKISSIDSWVGLGGCFECLLENLEIDGRVLFPVNAFVRSTMRNIKAKYNFNFLHLAYFSHHSLFENIEGTYDGPGDDDAGIDVGEAAHHLQFKNIKLNSTGRWRERAVVAFGNSSFNTVEGLQATLTHAPMVNIIEFRGDLYQSINNKVEDAVINYGGSLGHAEVAEKGNASGNRVLNTTINGKQITLP